MISAVPRIALAPGAAGEEVEHLRQRLDRRHAVAEGDERTAQLPRARPEIDDVARLVAGEPAHRVLGISGATALVRVRDSANTEG